MTSLLTVAEVAVRLRVSERSVRRLIASGQLRPKRIGSRVLVTDREIEAFLAHRDDA